MKTSMPLGAFAAGRADLLCRDGSMSCVAGASQDRGPLQRPLDVRLVEPLLLVD